MTIAAPEPAVVIRALTSTRGAARSPTGAMQSHIWSHHAVDPGRIGVCGTSHAGGHAIVLGATDSRAVVAQVPEGNR